MFLLNTRKDIFKVVTLPIRLFLFIIRSADRKKCTQSTFICLMMNTAQNIDILINIVGNLHCLQ